MSLGLSNRSRYGGKSGSCDGGRAVRASGEAAARETSLDRKGSLGLSGGMGGNALLALQLVTTLLRRADGTADAQLEGAQAADIPGGPRGRAPQKLRKLPHVAILLSPTLSLSLSALAPPCNLLVPPSSPPVPKLRMSIPTDKTFTVYLPNGYLPITSMPIYLITKKTHISRFFSFPLPRGRV